MTVTFGLDVATQKLAQEMRDWSDRFEPSRVCRHPRNADDRSCGEPLRVGQPSPRLHSRGADGLRRPLAAERDEGRVSLLDVRTH